MKPILTQSKKVAIGIVGGLIVLVGLILVPYPGPGWLIVFAGLALLATEFEAADRLLAFARTRYDAWVVWLKRQNLFVTIAVLSLTGSVVLVTLWLGNAFGIIVHFFDIDYPQLVSPLFR